jgi:hypothetical protein
MQGSPRNGSFSWRNSVQSVDIGTQTDDNDRVVAKHVEEHKEVTEPAEDQKDVAKHAEEHKEIAKEDNRPSVPAQLE